MPLSILAVPLAPPSPASIRKFGEEAPSAASANVSVPAIDPSSIPVPADVTAKRARVIDLADREGDKLRFDVAIVVGDTDSETITSVVVGVRAVAPGTGAAVDTGRTVGRAVTRLDTEIRRGSTVGRIRKCQRARDRSIFNTRAADVTAKRTWSLIWLTVRLTVA